MAHIDGLCVLEPVRGSSVSPSRRVPTATIGARREVGLYFILFSYDGRPLFHLLHTDVPH
ncbi:hypothetical protein GOODEAATRI_002316, partial [Goodea atripinnis]